jgi:hypothetical protein
MTRRVISEPILQVDSRRFVVSAGLTTDQKVGDSNSSGRIGLRQQLLLFHRRGTFRRTFARAACSSVRFGMCQ